MAASVSLQLVLETPGAVAPRDPCRQVVRNREPRCVCKQTRRPQSRRGASRVFKNWLYGAAASSVMLNYNDGMEY